MKLRQLEFFVRSVETGSFTLAADSMRVSQPTLGQQIRALEDEIGMKLLERGARGVKPTAAGQVLLVNAKDILSRVENAAAAMAALRAEARAKIRFGFPPTPGRLLVPELMVQLDESHGIQLQPHSALTDDLIALVIGGAIDAALCYDLDVAHGLDEVALVEEPLFLVGAPSIVKPNDGDIPFRDLSSFPLVLDGQTWSTRQRIDEIARQHDVRLNVSFEAEAIELRRELMRLRRRCTVVPIGAFFNAITAGELAARRIVDPEVSRTLHLVTRRDLDADMRSMILEALRVIVAGKVTDAQYAWREV
ncbi:LysR family transcriptional regulator [Sinorhizobium meliloti]|uniref:LysR family transcriptional regulator n=1 Tax=Rhizobium meliloti TaxID=382 RepID=UPI0018E26B35|nr:LysR family transcriptional regulator [Sinorhizobium meliloti]